MYKHVVLLFDICAKVDRLGIDFHQILHVADARVTAKMEHPCVRPATNLAQCDECGAL